MWELTGISGFGGVYGLAVAQTFAYRFGRWVFECVEFRIVNKDRGSLACVEVGFLCSGFGCCQGIDFSWVL